jgi:hypothetical protein
MRLSSSGVSIFSINGSTGTGTELDFDENGVTQWRFVYDANLNKIVWRNQAVGTNPFVLEDTSPTNSFIIKSTGKVGIGTADPDAKLDVLSTTEQLRLTYTDGSVYSSFITDSGGDLTITPSGGDIIFPTAVAITHTGSANNRAKSNRILYGATTDAATAVELTTNGSAGSGATNRIAVPADTSLSIVLNIGVKQSASANAKQMLRQVVITNNGGTTALSGTPIALGTDTGDAGLATVTTTITANNTDDCLKVEVNGVVGTNLRYTCYVVSVETLYA